MGNNIVICLLFNDAANTEIYTLSLHVALPIGGRRGERGEERREGGGEERGGGRGEGGTAVREGDGVESGGSEKKKEEVCTDVVC